MTAIRPMPHHSWSGRPVKGTDISETNETVSTRSTMKRGRTPQDDPPDRDVDDSMATACRGALTAVAGLK
jgi:hypothetical protein